jgi:hypothetical protein
VRPPEDRRLFKRHERFLKSELRRARPKLFQALEQFANMRSDKEGWAHFRKRWPDFFPFDEYEGAAQELTPSILRYPYWLNQIWIGGETNPYLRILLGIESVLEPKDEGTPEESWIAGLSSIPAKFDAEWDEGVFTYEGACDFQRALYLLFRESWRARICEKCNARFIAKRAAQKFCTTDCSESMQRELKRKWWAKHGEAWRKVRKSPQWKGKGGQNGPRKAR